jgi:hypothetical protein
MLSGGGSAASGSPSPVFETGPHPAERADPPTTSADTPIPDALSDALIDPDLVRIVGAWPTLPEPMRRAVLALIATTGPQTPAVPQEAAE